MQRNGKIYMYIQAAIGHVGALLSPSSGPSPLLSLLLGKLLKCAI